MVLMAVPVGPEKRTKLECGFCQVLRKAGEAGWVRSYAAEGEGGSGYPICPECWRKWSGKNKPRLVPQVVGAEADDGVVECRGCGAVGSRLPSHWKLVIGKGWFCRGCR